MKTIRKRLCGGLLALVMCLSLAVPAGAVIYPDTEKSWARETVDRWSDYGIVEGDPSGAFRPGGKLTRAEFATILARLMGYEAAGNVSYTDVKPNAWYADAIGRLTQAGVMQGYGNGDVRPKAQVTREEVAAMLCKVFLIEEDPNAYLDFADREELSKWAAGYVGALVEMGVFQGWRDQLRPKQPITRAEALTLLDRLAAGVIHEDGTYSSDVDGTLVVNAQSVTLKDMSVSGDLIVADGVGGGDVTLENVQVKGRLIIRGGGENSIHIVGDASRFGAIIVTKTASGRVRLVSESGAVIPTVNISDGKDGVLLEGLNGTAVVVSGAVDVTLGAGVRDVKVAVNAPAAKVSLSEGAGAASLDVAKTAGGSSVSIAPDCAVAALTVAAQVNVDNQGTIEKLDVQAGGVSVNGTAPGQLVVAQGVDQPTGTGAQPAPTPTPSPVPSPDDTPSTPSTPTPEPTPAPGPTVIESVVINQTSPRAGLPANAPSVAGVGYTAQVTWSPALTDGVFAANTAYTAKVTVSPASDSYRLSETIDLSRITFQNDAEYGDSAGLSNLSLSDGVLTFDATYSATADLVELQVSAGTPTELTVYKGLYCEWLKVDASLLVNGVPVKDRPIYYEWYCQGDRENQDNIMEGNYTYALVPRMDLDVGDYTFTCRVFSQGCEDKEISYTVHVAEPGDITFDASRIQLVNRDGRLHLDFNQIDPTVKAQKLGVTYTYIQNGETKTGDLGQNSYTISYLDLYNTVCAQFTGGHEMVTITGITLTPMNLDATENISDPYTFQCNITLNPGEPLPTQKGDILFDPTTGNLNFYNLDHHAGNVYSFDLNGYTTLPRVWPDETSDFFVLDATVVTASGITSAVERGDENIGISVYSLGDLVVNGTDASVTFRNAIGIDLAVKDSGAI